MLIAYLTTDEVNQDLATRMAADCGVALDILSPRDQRPDDGFDAAIYDLDYVPAELRDEILAKLVSGLSPFPIAVHSYNLLAGQIELLYQKGISVYRRLDRVVFLSLILAWRLSQLPAGQADEYVHRNGQQRSDSPADRPQPRPPIRATLPSPLAFPP